jgi:hypothetical protein
MFAARAKPVGADLIEPAAEPGAADRKKKAAGAEAGIGALRPRRARIRGTQ